MIKGVIIKDITTYGDERGWVAEIFRNDETDFQPVMTYVSMTNNNVVRGPHEHLDQTDYFVFCGPGTFEVHLWDRREDSETKGEYVKIVAGENEPKTIIVPNGVVHGYKCISETPGLSINLPDKLWKGKNKTEEVDEIRWEKDINSPYKII
ncbi:MAG: dTDP-4-dehydrorhamnose 3,5-epimerase [Candidatus Falkowbacteria bacterium GW2011_GWC2_38_22]|uniref:dTDP-4-dehydrorhamnose 3,5-epimerase n=1 Tax=Candidatus Falkowbacteria bacterium GW2011_GWE1_38_31 TaxID=1618638 RepID=A0A0G0JWL0_9BACT|nr:MAG: dTDP-4-dehydrorhamnose 3,5-epimerase [Candidatus Falkowbacteria bacterium GW2011_GWF2_38_1205]KKQ62172.1 MAG: dTDP-4-dehydrorhamnose 3,5-epimerase [Candidatus Falkowbacteria bacterium GW2011_GWC2_38_22]KKQ64322.1 MAG: dTDP-4-dehydrorhamnose 3,5-epimerase [Candidatus Falkowbacteria bacterium GW2011_GWF1_38_22]KKQ66299.1 MAG: dTDP-4-dehydrorhamnose 3,5-epimerase [Candidatus Falkowbacteria bacterium GW2011_GWE2_38_254]KKQ71027.1 MAG: dTDP-4-dehydrorhamnose 3,5-epimerase [Candidatus Falkowb